MDVVYVTHPAFAEHDTGTWHPERPARLLAAERGVMSSGLTVRRLEAPEATHEMLTLVHDPTYVEAIRRFCEAGGGALDPDTVAGPRSWEAALRAAGAGPAAVEALEGMDDATAFLAVRPPGHHALRNRAMGFCLFNNAAVTAELLRRRGLRVAILDWDVHHGNGTQELLGPDPELMYLSVHQHPFYPFAGHLDETGTGAGAGTVVNVPVPAGTGGDLYRRLLDEVLVPLLRRFAPDWLLISAGYDAHEQDPLAELRLVAADYGFMTSRTRRVVPPERTVVFLEGGYHLPAVTASVAATLRGLSGVETYDDTETRASPPAAWAVLEAVAESVSRRWDLT